MYLLNIFSIFYPYFAEENALKIARNNLPSVLAITVNLMLLRIVFTSQRREIGSYRYLIATFAVSDLIYTSVHWLVYPVSNGLSIENIFLSIVQLQVLFLRYLVHHIQKLNRILLFPSVALGNGHSPLIMCRIVLLTVVR